MGFRYRKSLNLGGGFRINISKSGIGYSWGVKGYRITKTSKGTTRKTSSIPGTGVSFVEETGSKQFTPNQNIVPSIDSNHYNTKEIVNNITNEFVSEGLEDILHAARRVMFFNKSLKILFWLSFFLFFIKPFYTSISLLFLLFKIFIKLFGRVKLEYCVEEDQKEIIESRLNQILKLFECKKIWRLIQSSSVIDKKYTSGASETIVRVDCKTSTKVPFPFKTSVNAGVFKSGKETLIFLPDKLFVIKKNKIGALNYSDIKTDKRTTRYIETESVPKDSEIVGQTWKYINKSGGPDRRFKDNHQLPICKYGELEMTSPAGLNTLFMFSNPKVLSL